LQQQDESLLELFKSSYVLGKVDGPEKAGGGDSIPSLATICIQ
jgi:hypothetical protein